MRSTELLLPVRISVPSGRKEGEPVTSWEFRVFQGSQTEELKKADTIYSLAGAFWQNKIHKYKLNGDLGHNPFLVNLAGAKEKSISKAVAKNEPLAATCRDLEKDGPEIAAYKHLAWEMGYAVKYEIFNSREWTYQIQFVKQPNQSKR